MEAGPPTEPRLPEAPGIPTSVEPFNACRAGLKLMTSGGGALRVAHSPQQGPAPSPNPPESALLIQSLGLPLRFKSDSVKRQREAQKARLRVETPGCTGGLLGHRDEVAGRKPDGAQWFPRHM
ncbi:hypothetical protein DPEC_G00074270 [Dallia pectoralis]|uniref:Uncharacterized protein n=1 Tax=Dallia pectoralis TaxID=75939 RepID=A0ACC2H318_DALPE|nr:hypothetical protein DPEC_G00074270 [Dallia pectoralis]